MKILYAARMARFDLLRATCYLATRITKWSKQCDWMLHRLVACINSTLDVYMTGWIADFWNVSNLLSTLMPIFRVILTL